MITRLAHICLQVRDIQRTIVFYRDGIGLPVKFLFRRKGEVKGAYFAIGDSSFIEAFESESPVGITHFCLQCDNIDDFMATVNARGIATTPKKLGSDQSWQSWLKDPDGNAFEVHQYTPQSMQLVGGEADMNW
jgi:predicted enzyme related to lactoylglutathione lyase